MTLKSRTIATFSFTLVLAASLCVATYAVVRDVNSGFFRFTEIDLKAIEYATRLGAALAEFERLQYEYYATGDLERISAGLYASRMDIIDVMERLAGMTNATLHDRVTETVQPVLDEEGRMRGVMERKPVDWDEARSTLTRLTSRARLARAAIDRTYRNVEASASARQLTLTRKLMGLVGLVFLFVLLAIVTALTQAFLTREALAAWNESKRLALFPEHNPGAVLSTGLDGKLRYANPAAHRLSAKLDAPLAEILPADLPALIKRSTTGQAGSRVLRYQVGERQLSALLQVLPDHGECHVYVDDVTEQHQIRAQLEVMAWNDATTGLPNRSALYRDLARWVASEIPVFGVLLVGFSRFDDVSRGLELELIDELLRDIGERLGRLATAAEPASATATVYRYSGASFAVLMPLGGTHRPHDAVRVFAERIVTELAASFHVRRREFTLTPSVGASLCPDDGTTPDQLLRGANIAMLTNSADGNPRLAFASPALIEAEKAWLDTESAIGAGIARGEFLLHYQPKVALTDGRVTGMEALLRWRKGPDGLVAPATFIPVAERSGQIVELGRLALAEACRQAHAWQRAGLRDFSVAVNVSSRQFQASGFVEDVLALVRAHGLAPGSLELEITESVLMKDPHKNVAKLQELRAQGVLLALDDFGTGYSSLEYLRRFPVTSIKIDRSFVQDIARDGRALALVRAVLELARGMGLKSVAEGVEDRAQETLLREHGCDEVQGYLHSRPQDAAAISRWWAERLHGAAA